MYVCMVMNNIMIMALLKRHSFQILRYLTVKFENEVSKQINIAHTNYQKVMIYIEQSFLLCFHQ